jgi:RimJ/RimL family protein N-acetyltransferase
MEMNEVRLETDRLILRWFREDDLADLCRMTGDPEVMKFLGDGQPVDEMLTWRHMATYMGHWYYKGFGIWAVEEKSSGRVVGRIGFMHPAGWPDFELGWTVVRDCWGKGYATEGAQRALDHAFIDMNRDHVISLIAPENVASIKVAERLGETVKGETRIMDRDVFIYGITRDEWKRRRNETA